MSICNVINILPCQPQRRFVPIRKNVEFYEDKELDQRFRSRLSDFKESGYDRGHMVRDAAPHPRPDSRKL